jgi:putative membrane protein
MALAFLVRVLVVAVALWIATLLVPGISVEAATTARGIGTLVGVALIFGLVNAVVKPVVKVLGCAFYILTLGLFALVVNALLFLLVGWLAGQVGLPYTVDGFGSAFFGAIVVGVVSFVLHVAIPDRVDRR